MVRMESWETIGLPKAYMETGWRERTRMSDWVMSWVSSSSLGLVSSEEWETDREKWKEELKVREREREREGGGPQQYQLDYKQQQQINPAVKPWPRSPARNFCWHVRRSGFSLERTRLWTFRSCVEAGEHPRRFACFFWKRIMHLKTTKCNNFCLVATPVDHEIFSRPQIRVGSDCVSLSSGSAADFALN